jgi:hypothetical protein
VKGCDSLQFAASGCNWLQVFHTKATKETKRKAEVESQARPRTGCKLLQLLQLAATGCKVV